MVHESIRSKIYGGQSWVNKKTGKKIIVLKSPASKHASVKIMHQSGRITMKQQHYFLYEYESI